MNPLAIEENFARFVESQQQGGQLQPRSGRDLLEEEAAIKKLEKEVQDGETRLLAFAGSNEQVVLDFRAAMAAKNLEAKDRRIALLTGRLAGDVNGGASQGAKAAATDGRSQIVFVDEDNRRWVINSRTIEGKVANSKEFTVLMRRWMDEAARSKVLDELVLKSDDALHAELARRILNGINLGDSNIFAGAQEFIHTRAYLNKTIFRILTGQLPQDQGGFLRGRVVQPTGERACGQYD